MKKLIVLSLFFLLVVANQVTWADDNGIIDHDKIYSVPTVYYPTIQDVLDTLSHKVIRPWATVTIEVANGVYENYQTIEITHVQGDRIRIIGNTTDEGLCIIRFERGVRYGLAVMSGRTLGLVDGFTFEGNLEALSHGIIARNNSTVVCGKHMSVRFFEKGVSSYAGSHVTADYIKADHNTKYGIFAALGSTILATHAQANDNGITGVKSNASVIDFTGGVARRNSSSGVHAYLAGFISCPNALLTDNNYGAHAQWGSTVNAPGATIINNATANCCPDANQHSSCNSIIRHPENN